MIRERCSCGSKFESDAKDAIKLWREWRRKHPCTNTQTDPDRESAANTNLELKLGFAPNEHPGREDPALEE